MSTDSKSFDDKVYVRETIEHIRVMSRFEYDVGHILTFLTPAEQIKLKRYITRITKGRITFPKYHKLTVRDFQKIDQQHQSI